MSGRTACLLLTNMRDLDIGSSRSVFWLGPHGNRAWLGMPALSDLIAETVIERFKIKNEPGVFPAVWGTYIPAH